MSNDMPDKAYLTEIHHKFSQSFRDGGWSTIQHNNSVPYYSESHVQQLIKEAEQALKQRLIDAMEQRTDKVMSYEFAGDIVWCAVKFEQVIELIEKVFIDK